MQSAMVGGAPHRQVHPKRGSWKIQGEIGEDVDPAYVICMTACHRLHFQRAAADQVFLCTHRSPVLTPMTRLPFPRYEPFFPNGENSLMGQWVRKGTEQGSHRLHARVGQI